MKALTQIRIFFIENVRTFRLAPVEMAIACYYFIISILGEHTDIKPSQDQIMIMPFALILAILCNKWFTTHKSRIIYYLSGCVVLPFWWINPEIHNPAATLCIVWSCSAYRQRNNLDAIGSYLCVFHIYF